MCHCSSADDAAIINLAAHRLDVSGDGHLRSYGREGRGAIHGENGEGNYGGGGSNSAAGHCGKMAEDESDGIHDEACENGMGDNFKQPEGIVESLCSLVHGVIADEEEDEQVCSRGYGMGQNQVLKGPSDRCRAAWNQAKEAILRSAKACNDRGVQAEQGGKVCSLSRSGQSRASAVEAAIAWHEQALALAELLPGIGDPERIAAGIALCRLYPSRSQAGQLPASLELALRHGRTALSLVASPHGHSHTRARAAVLRYLGQAYALRCKGGRDRNHALAERALLQCLSILGGDCRAQDEAEVHSLLAGVYSRRAYGREDRNCDLAAEHYAKAFEAFGAVGMRIRQIDTAVSAGTLLLRAGRNLEARGMFQRGAQVAEKLQEGEVEVGTRPDGEGATARRSLASVAVRQPPASMRAQSGIVAACIGLGDVWGGLEAAENSKAMSLAMRQQQQQQQQRVGGEGGGWSVGKEGKVQELVEGFGDAKTCYASFFEGPGGCLRVFIAGCGKRGGGETVETFAYSNEEVAALGKAAEEVRQAMKCFRGHFTGGVEHGVAAQSDGGIRGQEEEEEEEQKEDACEAAMSRVASLLRLSTSCGILASVPSGCTRLVISPPALLAGVPLTALPVHSGALRLIDIFDRGVTFTAGIRQLSGCAKRRSELPACAPSRLLAVGSPSGTDLRFTSHELRSLALGFESASVLDGEDAQEECISWALSRSSTQPDCVHFACHGRGGSGSVWESGLVLGGDELLTVSDLADWKLPKCRLVTLSACESAMPPSLSAGFSSGLPAAFIASGCPCVVGSLWKVSDACTTALMVKFYEFLHRGDAEGGGVGECLAMAQKWLREAKMSEVMRLLPKAAQDAWERDKGRFGVSSKRGCSAKIPSAAMSMNASSRRREGEGAARRQRRPANAKAPIATRAGGCTGTGTGTGTGSDAGPREDLQGQSDHAPSGMPQGVGDTPATAGEHGAGKSASARRCKTAFSSPFYWSSFVAIGW